jgi:iron complex outermembrane receptor protein
MLHKLTPILLIALLSYSTTAIASSCGSVYDDKLGWLQEVEVASGQAEPLREVPAPVTVITSQMIKDIGAKNLKDVLITYVPGITFIQTPNEVNVAVRGLYTSYQYKMLFLLNGHRMNARSYSVGNNPDYSIGLDKIECIEVLRAPGSPLYGNATLAAVINIITKKGTDLMKSEVSVGIGNYGQRKLSFVHGNEFENGKSDLLLWANYYKSDGETVNVTEDYSREKTDDPHAILDGFNDPASYDVGISYEFGDFTLLANQRYSKYIEPFSGAEIPGGESYNYADYMKLRGIGPGQGAKFSHFGIDFNKTFGNGLKLQLQTYYDNNEEHTYFVMDPTSKEYLFLAGSERALGAIAQFNRP